MSKYFHDLEFLACTPSCNIAQMDKEFLVKLDALRELCGFPLVLNCAYRTPEWDKSKGRSGKSYHTLGKAVDIKCFDSRKRAAIIMNAIYCGLSVGVYSSFLHVDCRPSGPIVFYGISYGAMSSSDLD